MLGWDILSQSTKASHYRFCPVNSLNGRTFCAIAYTCKEEFNSKLSLGFKYDCINFPALSWDFFCKGGLIVYDVMNICPAKNGLQKKMTRNQKKGNSYKQRLTSGFNKSILLKMTCFHQKFCSKQFEIHITNESDMKS